MATDQVGIWRPTGEDRVLLMAGWTARYAIEPRGEYVFGVVSGQAMRSRRGRERRLVRPGQLVAWDPSEAHSGSAVDGRPWSARLILVAAADLAALAGDEEFVIPADLAFPEPVLTDPELANHFVALHKSLEAPATCLERDGRLAEWLRALIDRALAVGARRSRPRPADDRALRLAREHLADLPERNVSLDELAAIAGVGKFRLIRLFREQTGLPPHAFQIADRLRRARRLLEAGTPIAAAAADAGFADQSQLHRHFRRSLGLTPGQYQRRFRG